MARGELAVYTIKSEYAYGSTGSPPKIPGGATLTFEIEVILECSLKLIRFNPIVFCI